MVVHGLERLHMDTLPQEFRHGVEQFNRAYFFEAHETLEDLWRGTSGPLRLFYQGLIQLAVALYHLSNGNRRGALNLLGKGLDKLAAYQPACQGIDVEALCCEARAWLDRVRQAGERELSVDPEQLPRIRWITSERNPA
jgi:predicted metal-dependent hydrolase